ncbi:M20 metallopeptidase family protein [Candidatus Hodarchaeum mangrovi]
MDQTDLINLLIEHSKELEYYIISKRRYFHMHPETAFEETSTASYIEKELQKIGYNTIRAAKTGVIASIPDLNGKKTVALRADIDALNIQEETDVDYKSKFIGKMHACGHDAHSAMLLGAAKIIIENKQYLTGPIKLIFQPAEEGGAGAKYIIEEGHLKDVNCIFGLHLWHDLPSGVIGTRIGPVFASSDRFLIKIIGKGGHVANPHQTIDPTPVLNDIYASIQKIISREVNPFEPVVLALPKFRGSEAHNIIPSEAYLQGTLRTLNSGLKEYIKNRISEIVVGYSKAWRCKGTVTFDPLAYPVVVNTADIVEKCLIFLQPLNNIQIMDQSMVGEDFAFYLENVPGVFFTLGNYNEQKGIIYPHHHPQFQVDESVLWKGSALYSILAFYPRWEALTKFNKI